MAGDARKIRGTREWAVANIDCCDGCSHGCHYCYARYDAVIKRKTIAAEGWLSPIVKRKEVERIFPRYLGTVMFPTCHDILPEILDACITVIENLLLSGNRVLIVSKPHLSCIEELCRRFQKSRDRLLFRFTIGAMDDRILSFWEPFAPSYTERFACLQHAFHEKFVTSVSIEPMLDGAHVVELVEELAPYVSHSIWLGKMNKITQRVVPQSEEMIREIERIEEMQTDAEIKKIYSLLENNPLLRWKESIKEVVGLKLMDEPGLDM